MVDLFRERTAPAADGLPEFCAREPGTPAPAPSTPEAAVLRHVAARVLEANRETSCPYTAATAGTASGASGQDGAEAARRAPWPQLGPRGLTRDLRGVSAGEAAADDPTAEETTAASAGTVAPRGPSLCAQFCERHRAWLMANGGWVSKEGRGAGGQPGMRPPCRLAEGLQDASSVEHSPTRTGFGVKSDFLYW